MYVNIFILHSQAIIWVTMKMILLNWKLNNIFLFLVLIIGSSSLLCWVKWINWHNLYFESCILGHLYIIHSLYGAVVVSCRPHRGHYELSHTYKLLILKYSILSNLYVSIVKMYFKYIKNLHYDMCYYIFS